MREGKQQINPRSSPPTGVEGLAYYDDGTNTDSGDPGWRAYVSGSWIDIGGGVNNPMTEDLDANNNSINNQLRWRHLSSESPIQSYDPPFGKPIILSDLKEAENPVLTASDISGTTNLVADPFLYFEDGQWHMFFEIDPDSGDQVIGHATSSDGIKWTYDQEVLTVTDYDLSFPHVFKFDGTKYMIPNIYKPSDSSSDLRIYKATTFPTSWTLEENIMNRADIKDPVPVYWNGKWFIIFGGGAEGGNELDVIYSDNLIGGSWSDHPSNPIKNDAKFARPAGRPITTRNYILLPMQDTTNNSLRMIKINTLTTSSYSDEEVSSSPILEPEGIGWKETRMHHADIWKTDMGENGLVAVDGLDDAVKWSIGIYKAGEGSGNYTRQETSYTVGLSGDFADLVEAAEFLRGSTLQGNITLTLQKNITVSKSARFQGITGSGGKLAIDLGGYTYEVDSGSPDSVLGFFGPFTADISNGTLKASTASTQPLWYLIQAQHGANLTLDSTLTLDASNNAYYSVAKVDQDSQISWQNPSELGMGSLNHVVRVSPGGRLTCDNGQPSSINSDEDWQGIIGNGLRWQQESGSPYTVSAASDLTVSFTDTGKSEYLVILDFYAGTLSNTPCDLSISWPNETSWDYIDRTDTRTANTGMAVLWNTINTFRFQGVLRFTARQGNIKLINRLVHKFSQTGKVVEMNGDNISSLEGFTLNSATAGDSSDWNGTIEVYYRE